MQAMTGMKTNAIDWANKGRGGKVEGEKLPLPDEETAALHFSLGGRSGNGTSWPLKSEIDVQMCVRV